MDALILSCGTGGGHNTAGRALEQELLARGHRATFLDPYDLAGERTSRTIDNTYIGLAQRAPGAFGALYGLGNAYRRLPWRSPVYHANRAMVPVLQKYLDTHPCDAVVMPHLFPAEIITQMKRRGLTVPASYFVATDYTCIPFTEETECDRYIIPAPDLTEEFVARGLPRERLVPLGIPVRREFTARSPREAREALGFGDGRVHILLAGGSIGAGSLEQSVRALLGTSADFDLTVVCGSNGKVYDRLNARYGRQARILDRVEDFAGYMLASDIFITKPGGLSTTEAAAIGAALVHVTPIPGCETRNMEFFASRGMSLPVRSPQTELADACRRLLVASSRAAMQRAQLEHLPRDAAQHIVDLMEDDLAGPGR